MVAGLHKVDLFARNHIYQTMFLGNPPGPHAGAKELQGLGFSNALKRISHDRLDQLKNAKCGLAVCFHPEPEVLSEFRMKYRFPLGIDFVCPLSAFTQHQPHCGANRLFENRQIPF